MSTSDGDDLTVRLGDVHAGEVERGLVREMAALDGVVNNALGYSWHTIDEEAHLWFGMLTGNGEIYTTATFVNTDYSEDCLYGDLSYTSGGTFDVVFLQENDDDLDLKTLWMTI